MSPTALIDKDTIRSKSHDNIESSSPALTEMPFDTQQWLTSHVGVQQAQTNVKSFARQKDFKAICDIVHSDIKEAIVNSATENENELFERQHDAIVGKPEAVNYFIDKVNEALRKHNLTSTDYPSFYHSLSEAIFHEVWGLSILYKWERYPDSEAAVISGTELWLDLNGKFERQKESFSSIEHVNRIKEAFKMRSENNHINKQSPELELERENGDRITMIQPPRSREEYIMLRRFVVKNLTLEQQAQKDTIPKDDIPIYRALARVMANTLIAGRVRSAKSTFMKTLIAERDPDYVIASMEKHHELRLKDHLPDRLIFEVQAKEGDLHQAVPRLLRMEHDYIVVGEIRSLEMEGFMEAAERGERGALSTYHLTDVENIVPQLARHLLDEFPNRTPEIEIERVARNLDIVITMTAERNRQKKRVMSVTEVLWDDDNRKYSVVDLVRYSPISKKYYYHSGISKRLYRLMREENEEEAVRLMNMLMVREKESPMSMYRSEMDRVD